MSPFAKRKWILLLVLALIVSTAGAQDAVEMPPPDENGRRFSLWQEFQWLGPVRQAGLVAIVLALAGMASARYIVSNRRQTVALFVVCLGVGLTGYAVFDIVYVLRTLSMRDVQRVRDDCEKLMQAQKLYADESNAMLLAEAQLPASLVRIGAKMAEVEVDTVVIITEPGMNSSEGILYDPKHVYNQSLWFGGKRAMIYRGFYDWRYLGE